MTKPIGRILCLSIAAGCLGLLSASGSATACTIPVPPCNPADAGSDCFTPEEPDPRCEPKDCDKCAKSPCYVASGMFSTQAVDLWLPTAGFPLAATRRYQSAQTVDGPMGHGWTSGLTVQLHETTYRLTQGTSEKVAYVIMPDGSRYEFVGNADGTFSAPVGRHDDLIRNADGSFDLWLQRSLTSYHFGIDGSLEAMTDEYGNQLVYSYDGNGRLLRVEDTSGSGRYLDVYWGADGRISNVVDSAGREVGYTYSAEGQLTGVTDPLGRTTTYEYVEGKYTPLLAEVRDEWDRVVMTVTYDSQDRTTSYMDQGETYTYNYNYQNDPSRTAKTDSSGNTWVYTHGEGGLVTQDQAPGGATTRQTEYYPDGSIMLEIDEVGVKTFYTYDAEGRILSVTQDHEGPEAVRFDYEYDLDFPDQVASITPRNPGDDSLNPHWQAWRYDYYPAGSPAPGAIHHVYRVRADGSTLDTLTTYEYDSQGRRTAVTDAAGGRTEYVYGPQGNLMALHSPANNTAENRPETHYAYDTLDRLTSLTDPMGSVTTYTYDALGRVLTVTLPPPMPGSPLDFTTAYTYDQFDAATDLTFTEVTDPNGLVTKHGYDQYGRLVEHHDALGGVTRYDYSNALASAITDANGNVTTYLYDPQRQLSQTLFPDGASESYTYNADGLLATRTDRKGQTIAYEYDAFKRLTTTTYPDGTSVTYTYQGQKLTQVTDSSTDPDESHTYVYDDAYRVNSDTQANRGTLNYTYTPTDQLASLTVVGGPTASYTYYPDQTLHTIEWTPVAGLFEYAYTLRGQYQSLTFPNGQQRLYSHDDQGRLLQLANIHPSTGNLATYSYAYDTNHFTGQQTMLGQRTSMVTTNPAQGLVDALAKYYYDATYQLVRADYPPGEPFNAETHEWTYDLLGNRLSNTIDGVTETSYYQQVPGNASNWQRLLAVGDTSYTYDANGNVSALTNASGLTSLTHDPENRLTRLTGAVRTAYLHDFRHRRAELKYWSRPTGNKIATHNRYLYHDVNIVAEVEDHTYFLHGPGLDLPLATMVESQVYFYGVDGLGSVVVLTDFAGTVVDSNSYDAWGVSQGSRPAFTIMFGFTAREPDVDSLVFLRARYYDSRTGRFWQEDPVGLFGGPNRYAYVLNKPLDFTDPLGLFCTFDFVRHYYKGYGTPIDLADVGLLDRFRNHPSVAAAVSGFKAIAGRRARTAARELCRGKECGWLADRFELRESAKDRPITDMGWDVCLFPLGDSSFFREGTCNVAAHCKDRKYLYKCSLTFYIRDEFQFQRIRETGTVYDINADWTDSTVGGGRF